MLQELQPANRIWNILKVNLLERPNVYTILRNVIYKNFRDLSARQNPALFFFFNLKPVKYSMINYGLRCFAAGAFMVT